VDRWGCNPVDPSPIPDGRCGPTTVDQDTGALPGAFNARVYIKSMPLNKRITATLQSGCRGCGKVWPQEQLVYQGNEGWYTTCSWCGLRQAWAWVK
jgi:hypothetical protein